MQLLKNKYMTLNTINSDSGTDLHLPYHVKKHITVYNYIIIKKFA